MALFGGSRRERAAAGNEGAAIPPAVGRRGQLPELRDSRALAREVAVAKSISDTVGIDADSLAGNGGERFENQPTVEVRFDHLSPLRQGTEILEAKLAQGVYGERDRPLVEAELRRRRQGHEEHDLAELRERLARLEQQLRDKDAELRTGQRWIRIFTVIAVIFITAWLIEIVPPLLQILAAS